METKSLISDFLLPLFSAGIGTAAGAFIVNHANEEKLIYESKVNSINSTNYIIIQNSYFIDQLFADLIHVKSFYSEYKENQNKALSRFQGNLKNSPKITRIFNLTHEHDPNILSNHIYKSTDNVKILTYFSRFLESTKAIKNFDKELSICSEEIIQKLKSDEKLAVAEYFSIPFNRTHNDSIDKIYGLLIQSIAFSILVSHEISTLLVKEKQEEKHKFESYNFKKLPDLVKPQLESIFNHHYFPKKNNFPLFRKME